MGEGRGDGARHQGADKNIIAAATASKLFTSNYAQRPRLCGAARPRWRALLLHFLAVHRRNLEELVNYRPSLSRNDGPVNEVTAPVNRDVFIIAVAPTEAGQKIDVQRSDSAGQCR